MCNNLPCHSSHLYQYNNYGISLDIVWELLYDVVNDEMKETVREFLVGNKTDFLARVTICMGTNSWGHKRQ